MSRNAGIKIVAGGASQPLASETETASTDVPAFLDQLARHGIGHIDTAALYGDSQKLLGIYKAAEKGFIIDTKVPGGFVPGTITEEGVLTTGHEALQLLGIKQINIFYIHSPDTSIPLESTLAGINKLHQEGAFKHFGLSNYTAEQVREVYNHCKQHGYVLPTVYQGSYNAFARNYEAADGGLFPVLRELGISFYAYSPAAGGFLSKTPENLGVEGGRFDKNSTNRVAQLYLKLYAEKPALLKGHIRWAEIAKEAGVAPGAMALRWVRFNSYLKPEFDDAIIVGARSLEQREESLRVLEDGPLSDDIAQKIDEIWELIKHEAPTDNYHDFYAGKKEEKK